MKFRRVVTGHNEKGKSYVKWDTGSQPHPAAAGGEPYSHVGHPDFAGANHRGDPNTWNSEPAWEEDRSFVFAGTSLVTRRDGTGRILLIMPSVWPGRCGCNSTRARFI